MPGPSSRFSRSRASASMPAMLRIRSATPLDALRVRLVLTDGTVVERDLDALLDGPLLGALRQDRARFRAVSVDHGALTWPGAIHIDPDVVIWGGAAPMDPAARPPRSLRVPVPA